MPHHARPTELSDRDALISENWNCAESLRSQAWLRKTKREAEAEKLEGRAKAIRAKHGSKTFPD